MRPEVARYDQLDSRIEARANALLSGMSLSEKVGQLVQVGTSIPEDAASMERRMKEAAVSGKALPPILTPRPGLEDDIRAGKVGSLLNVAEPARINHYQRLAVKESRQGVPLLIGCDVIHGFRTIFPIPLAESCSWNLDLIERASRVAAEEASAHGINWIFAPMVDIARDPRWGRIAEGSGEDPFLGAELARARVRGFQGNGLPGGRRIAACPKHFAGYGAAEAGRDYNTVELSERTLRELHLPPFKAAFDAGAGSVMSAFNEIAGVPATVNSHLLRTVLRDEWQWPGVVLTDYEAIRELIAHGVARDLKDAARLSILAGVDMDMVSDAYALHLESLIDEGHVPLAFVDEAVRRVLRLKLQLGLFEEPYADETLARQVVLSETSRALALEVAQQSVVLVKNDGALLPLAAGTQRVAVIGGLAASRQDQLGTWVLFGRADEAESVLDGIQAYLDAGSTVHVPGYPAAGDGAMETAEAVAAARAADIVILVVGENANMSGEARSRAHLGLPGHQQELVDAIVATGKPVACVLMSGRPLVISRLAGQVNALLIAWHGGLRGGRAVADILFGAVNPSGKLTASWPVTEGQIPLYYAHKNTGRPIGSAGTMQFSEPFTSRYIDVSNDPLFPFGFGLSYTHFTYRDLTVEPGVVAREERVSVTAVIENSGNRAGVEIVQLYVRDRVASVTRPVKELKGFQNISLKPGQVARVRFEIPAELGFIGPDMRYVVEPGEFTVWIGPNSRDGLEGRFEIR